MISTSSAKTHTPFAPSAFKRRIACPGSMTLEAENPDDTAGFDAQWGSAGHQLGEMRLKRVLTCSGLTQTVGKTIREIAPLLDPDENGFLDIVVDEEMIWVVQEYVIFCESLLPRGCSTLDSRVAIEARLKFAEDDEAEGTADFVFSDWPLTLHVDDLKTGHALVEAENNPQLACYGLGALRKFGMDYETIRMTIFQDRIGNVSHWEMPVEEFVEEWQPVVDKTIARAKSETTTYIPGDHCKWCSGALVCPKTKKAFNALAKISKSTLEAPIDPARLSKILKAEAPVLEYLNQCKAQADKLITQGVRVPGYKIVQTWGREKWSNEKRVTAELDKRASDNAQIFNPKKPKTPKQIRKLLGNNYPSELDKLTVTPNNGTKLVPESDKRAAYSSAAEVFDCS